MTSQPVRVPEAFIWGKIGQVKGAVGRDASRIEPGNRRPGGGCRRTRTASRKNLRETPNEAEVYATYLKKLSDQEKEIDALTAKQKGLVGEEFATRKKYEDY